MREEAAGADAGVIRDALDDADQHVALAVVLRDRAAAVAHAGAGADRAAAARIDQRVVAAVVDEPRLAQAGRMHARAFLRGAVAGDGVGAFAAGRAGRDRNELRGQGARERELRGLSGRAVARDRDALAAGDHEERAGTFDAVIGGEQLLAPDHDRSAQKIMADQLDDVAADSAGRTAAHHRVGIARGKNKGGRRRQNRSNCRDLTAGLGGCRKAHVPHERPLVPNFLSVERCCRPRCAASLPRSCFANARLNLVPKYFCGPCDPFAIER